MTILIRRLDSPTADDIDGLAAVLVDCVDGGASVSFVRPLSSERAVAFWRGVADDVQRRSRVLIVAQQGDIIVGTVQLAMAAAENQQHRADLCKMLVLRSARGRGIGAQLIRSAENAARDAAKSLLVLDTANTDAEPLYARMGWVKVGVIPGYTMLADGEMRDTAYFYRDLNRAEVMVSKPY